MREQLGKPIGSFQTIKHHCANMALNAMAANDLLSFVAVAVAQGRPDAQFEVTSALIVALRAAHRNAAINIQIHGGIGFSDECNAHIFLKRTHIWAAVCDKPDRLNAQLHSLRFPLEPT